MSQDLICSWLQLPNGNWPPDHYTLLGLPPGEGELARIEQAVFERMQRVRQYQLIHPEPATEAMNRLAQALICLSDAQAKSAYDAERFPDLPPSAKSGQPATADDPLGWLFGPWTPGAPVPAGAVPAGPSAAMLADWQAAPP